MTQVRKLYVAVLLLLLLGVATAEPGSGVVVNPIIPSDQRPVQEAQHLGS